MTQPESRSPVATSLLLQVVALQVINDLLEPSSTNLLLREDPSRGGVIVEGVKSVEVWQAVDLVLRAGPSA